MFVKQYFLIRQDELGYYLVMVLDTLIPELFQSQIRHSSKEDARRALKEVQMDHFLKQD